ncbi:histone deacetylase 11 [Melanotaenia boesemani]|uniref:histone deacetylase 11 n=1 Tax=Melanotaenia boesemani TaxID=1250792 RepID=UPI001C05530A|nr:histone deacetylase 11 [Melanotaenia boesemani]
MDLVLTYGLPTGVSLDLVLTYGLSTGVSMDLVLTYGLSIGGSMDLVLTYGPSTGVSLDLVLTYGLSIDLVLTYGPSTGVYSVVDLAVPTTVGFKFYPTGGPDSVSRGKTHLFFFFQFLFERVEGISRATIIDLDAHQGNGHERDFLDDRRVFIMDMYNRYIYPGDAHAKRAIKRKVELDWGTEDSEYLQKVELHSEGALNEVRPDIIVYNAGTDILDGDPLGGLSISPQGIIKRDEIVFKAAKLRGIPILMVTSGGYQKKTARIIADSILNLQRQGLIGVEAVEGSSPLVAHMMAGSGSPGSMLTAV